MLGPLHINEGDTKTEQIRQHFQNCTRCDKCLRTITTIDILGEKDKYDRSFDLEFYDKIKNRYIGKVIANRRHDTFYKEIFLLMKSRNYSIPMVSYVWSVLYRVPFTNLLKNIANLFGIKQITKI